MSGPLIALVARLFDTIAIPTVPNGGNHTAGVLQVSHVALIINSILLCVMLTYFGSFHCGGEDT